MPQEVAQLQNAPTPLEWCPKCHAPFEAFLRGSVQRSPRRFIFFGRTRPYCALICRACKEIVGHEDAVGNFELE